MLRNELSIALKEWAVVQRSLLEQHQLLLVRKGGIAEETGDFDLKADQFLILPGYEHETERKGDLQPCFAQWLKEEEAQKPQLSEIRFECACKVVDVLKIEDRDVLMNLMPQHIWSRQFIDARFDWEPYKPVFALIVRAYRLLEPVTIQNRREYGGCRSWVTLEESISTTGAVPAIVHKDNFERRRNLTLSQLQQQRAVR